MKYFNYQIALKHTLILLEKLNNALNISFVWVQKLLCKLLLTEIHKKIRQKILQVEDEEKHFSSSIIWQSTGSVVASCSCKTEWEIIVDFNKRWANINFLIVQKRSPFYTSERTNHYNENERCWNRSKRKCNWRIDILRSWLRPDLIKYEFLMKENWFCFLL